MYIELLECILSMKEIDKSGAVYLYTARVNTQQCVSVDRY